MLHSPSQDTAQSQGQGRSQGQGQGQGQGAVGTRGSNANSSKPAPVSVTAQPYGPPTGGAAVPEAPEFTSECLAGGPAADVVLLDTFTKILTEGIVINLHTTKVPQ